MPIAPDGSPLPYPEDEQQIPPQLLALLGGGGALAPAGFPPGGPGGTPPGPPPGGEEPLFRNADEAWRVALQAIRVAIDMEPDDQDTLLGEQATTLLQKILASQDKQQLDALAGKADPRFLRRNG